MSTTSQELCAPIERAEAGRAATSPPADAPVDGAHERIAFFRSTAARLLAGCDGGIGRIAGFGAIEVRS
jgi:hypothetical protein